jgi:hypothetical protein
MTKPKIYNVQGFQFAYIRSPRDLCGTMHNFVPHWWIQYLGNGETAMLDTKKACLAWIREFNSIGE